MIRSKLSNVGTSIFAVMTKMANEYNAINLSQGFPDFDVSEILIEKISQKMKIGLNQYAPMPGVLELRNQISNKTFELHNYKYNPETEITVTAGGTQALYTAITATVQDGDEVIIFDPAYDSYAPVVRLNGGIPIFISLKYPDYEIDWNEVTRLISSRTRLIIFNSPQNPSGTTWSLEDMKMLQKLVNGTKILILSDEVYEHIIFDDNVHHSVSKFPLLAERSLVIGSFGKTYHATGWKIGYCLAPEKITKEFRKIHQFNVFCVNTPIQHALAEHLEDKNEYLKLSKFYQQKRDLFVNQFNDSGLIVKPSKGTYFQTIDFSGCKIEKDTEICEILTKQYGVAGIPMSAFYHDTVKSSALRFCFAKSELILVEAAKKIIKFYNENKL